MSQATDPKLSEKPRPSVNVNVLTAEPSAREPPSTRKGVHLRRLVIGDTSADTESPCVPSGRWTPRAESRLRDAVRLHGENAWEAVSKEAFSSAKSPEECKTRWESVSACVSCGVNVDWNLKTGTRQLIFAT
jgi:hypothetical protein